MQHRRHLRQIQRDGCRCQSTDIDLPLGTDIEQPATHGNDHRKPGEQHRAHFDQGIGQAVIVEKGSFKQRLISSHGIFASRYDEQRTQGKGCKHRPDHSQAMQPAPDFIHDKTSCEAVLVISEPIRSAVASARFSTPVR